MTDRHDAEELAAIDRELRDVFAPRRPDAAKFSAGVAARLAARAQPEPTVEAESKSRFDRAASGLVDAGASLGGTQWLAWLTWPALLLAGSLFGGLGAASTLRRELGRAPAAGSKPTARSQARVHLATLPMPILVLLGLVFGAPMADVLVGMVLLAMVAFTVQIRILARHGLTRRDQVAHFALSLLETLFQMSIAWTFFSGLNGHEPWGGPGVAWLLLASIAALLPFAGRGRRWLSLVYLALVVFLLPPSVTLQRDSATKLAADVASVRLQPDQLVEWHALACAVEALKANGTEVVLVPELVADVRSWIERGVDLHPQVLSAAWRLGLLDDSAWQQLANREPLVLQREAWARTGAVYASDYDLWQLPAWFAAHPADADERARLQTRIDTLWTPRGLADPNAMPLRDAWLAVRWGELLDATRATASRAAQLRELLLRHQVPAMQLGEGAFTDFPSQQLGANAAATFRALDLVARVGAPEGLDLAALHVELRRQSQRERALRRTNAGDWLLHRANLVYCEHLLGTPSLTPGRWLLEARVLLAMLATALLCGYAVWLAPPERSGKGPVP